MTNVSLLRDGHWRNFRIRYSAGYKDKILMAGHIILQQPSREVRHFSELESAKKIRGNMEKSPKSTKNRRRGSLYNNFKNPHWRIDRRAERVFDPTCDEGWRQSRHFKSLTLQLKYPVQTKRLPIKLSAWRSRKAFKIRREPDG